MDPRASLFLQSMLIGLSIAAPVGQIGVLAIQRTLQQGQRAGLATGLGAALADAVYGAIGAFGVAAVTHWLIAAKTWLGLGGALFLAVMAVRLWRADPAHRAAAAPGSADLARLAAGTFMLTLSNPTTILSFIAVFGVLAGRSAALASPLLMVLGVLIGSALWWVLLSALVGRVRHRFDARWQKIVNRLSALVLAAFAAWQLLALAG